MESACRQMESDRSLHRKNKAESETGSSGRRRLCDESSLKKAVKNYLSRFDRAFKSSKTSYPHTFFNDSYEVYQADWTDDFLEQFARRRGYKLEEHFPEFLDKNRRKLADVSCRITGKPFPTSYWRTSVINGQTGHTKTVVSPVIRHMVRPVI